MTSSSITVQWEMVPCIHRNGDITGYSVQYEVVGSGSPQSKSVSGGGTLKTTITGLMPSIIYSIQVAAVNDVSTGEYMYSEKETQQTDGKVLNSSCPHPQQLYAEHIT